MFEFGILKDLLPPSKFSLFGYMVVVLYPVAGVLLIAFAANVRSREYDKFQCKSLLDILSDENNQYLRDECYQKYDSEYNSRLPLWVFVLIECILVLGVSLVYSCCVQAATVQILPIAFADAEGQRLRQRQGRKRIFRFYFLQLTARLCLTILFLVLQNSLSFSLIFPSQFLCVLSTVQPRQVENCSTTNITKTELKPRSPTFQCRNLLATDKSFVSILILIINIACLVLVSGEMTYLLLRAFRRSNFTVDAEFRASYFYNRSLTHEVRSKLKKKILQNTENIALCLFEGKRLVLDEIFIDLAIHMKKPNGVLISVSSYEELYLPIRNIVTDAPRVLVVGAPGSGKSLLCQKLLRDWCKKTSRESFDFAFLFKFSWFNSEETSMMSLKGLLNRGACSDDIVEQVFQHLVDNPARILLIFDGLDEFKQRDNLIESNEAGFPNSLALEMPVLALYLKLLTNKLLPGATVLTTCRPNVVVQGSYFDRIVHIEEFTDEKVYKWVGISCSETEDSNVAMAVKEYVSSTPHLLSLCRIPVFCYIVCHFLMSLIIQGNLDCVRLTDVYQRALNVFIFMHHPDYKGKPFTPTHPFSNSVEKTLATLGSLAKKGILEDRREFRCEEIDDGMRDCSLLKKIPQRNGEECFIFIHSTLQDFLAARKIVKMPSKVLERRVSRNLQAEKENWFLVLQFILGLLQGQSYRTVVNTFIDYLKKSLLSSSTNGKMALLMIKCFHEYNDDDTIKKVAQQLQHNSGFSSKINLQQCQVTSADCKAIVCFLKHFDSLESVDLSNNSIGEDGVKELAKLVETGGPKKLNLSNNRIADQDIISLLKAAKMSGERSNLHSLGIDERYLNLRN